MPIYQILKIALRRSFTGSIPILTGATLLVIILSTVTVYFAEHGVNDDFQHWGDCLWWILVTISTVGYGDKAPKSTGGKALAVIWMFTAIIIISGITAAITSALTVSRLGSDISGVEDLHNIRVGTVADTTSQIYMEESRISHRSFTSLDECLSALSDGEIDAVLAAFGNVGHTAGAGAGRASPIGAGVGGIGRQVCGQHNLRGIRGTNVLVG